MGIFKRKKKKLSDEVVLQKWGKKPMQFIANDQKVTVEPIVEDYPAKTEYIMVRSTLEPEPNIEDYMAEYEQQTGKHAEWGGKVTKQFLNWKEKYVLSEM